MTRSIKKTPQDEKSQAGLLDIIRRTIEIYGPMSIETYMGLCMGHPVHGYYMKQDPFGEKGDFITAPEISQIFGELIGAWLAYRWMQTGQPESFSLVEFGPGRGTLMNDILRATRSVPGFHAAMNVTLIDMSPALIARQKETLKNYDVKWAQGLDDIPARQGPVFAIGNEFLDALPFRQFKRDGDGWREVLIALDQDGALCLGLSQPVIKPVETALSKRWPQAKDGQIVELPATRDAFITALSKLILQTGGTALFMDYGFYNEENGNTFQALKDHKPVNPWECPGDADLTSHVDFKAVEDAARAAGLDAYGPVEQGTFLNAMGASERTEALCRNADTNTQENLRSGLERLIDPEKMGKLFKTISLCHPDDPRPEGFPQNDK